MVGSDALYTLLSDSFLSPIIMLYSSALVLGWEGKKGGLVLRETKRGRGYG